MWSGAKSPVSIGTWNNGLFLLGAFAGLAPDYALSTRHDEDSCATDPRKLSIDARVTAAPGEALTKAPSAALLSTKRTILLPRS